MLIYILIFIEIILLISTYYCFQKSFFSPSFVFLGGFLIASICAAFFQDKWGEILHWNSFVVYFVGFITFFITSLSIHILYRKIRDKNNKNNNIPMRVIDNIEIPKTIYLVFTVIHIMAIIFLVKRVRQTAAMYGTIGSWKECIEKYRYIVAFTTNDVARISKLAANMINITKIGGFFWNVVFIYNFLCERRKISILALTNLILCIICDFLGGSRTGTIIILISSIVVFYAIWSKKNINKKKLPFKYVFRICIILLLIVISFQFLGGLIGRNVDVSFAEYFAKYVGSPMKNLDVFMQQDHRRPEIWGKETFAYFINWVGNKTQNSSLIYNLDLPYIELNGFNMGNVYTTFYMFVYDFGLVGVIGCTAIMSAISQIYYELAIGNNKSKIFNVIIYSMIVPQLILSFFSNKFYETFATYTFIQRAIILVILIYLLLKYRVSFSNREIKIQRINTII